MDECFGNFSVKPVEIQIPLLGIPYVEGRYIVELGLVASLDIIIATG